MNENRELTKSETIRFFAGIGLGIAVIIAYALWLRII